MSEPDDAGPALEAVPETPARVLALHDAAGPAQAALAAAVRLAERQGRELVVLVVEDQDLLHSAAFPFAREVGGHSGRVRRLSVAALEAGLARQGERVRQALARAVAGRQLPHSLQVRRGRVLEETLALAVPGDLLLLNRAGETGASTAWLGASGLALMLSAPCPVLVWHEAAAGPLLVASVAGESPCVPDPLRALFGEAMPLRFEGAAALSRRLATCRGGALLMRRETLRALLAEDADWLSRPTIPVIVLP
ncbi:MULTISPECIES: hypothetical protein [Halomonas]|uniref:UspA domain-containing protein n=1 Tax=Halomonas halophila TaxID=29573 RepID=A0ABQ0U0N8_9GAMM|nr:MULTISPECIES: hypothetical protein [Halomonas]MDR5888252.1 hypothetical protein [Halomonas salina]RAH36776.1 hypothetical protein C9J49_014590 [Halomonas sp. SL1]WJY08768.1 hypothetical protein QWG60_07660 [Halomonas halophila]GEK71882.1 hypothetical protein HHA04nite_04260 [Halomonas halophila]